MKMTAKTNIKGVAVEFTFEGSIKEMMAVNTATVKAAQEWINFFSKEGDHIFNMLDRAIDRASITSKKVILAEKEDKDFRDILNGNYKK